MSFYAGSTPSTKAREPLLRAADMGAEEGHVSTDKNFPRITFGVIVLNGEPFTKYCLRQVYPFAHEIIVVEGAYWASAAVATPDGHSIDNTLEELYRFKREEDPRGIVQIITKDGLWESLTAQSQAYAARATGDYLWQVDIDEFYKREDMQAVIGLLTTDPSITVITFKGINFCFDFNYTLTSGRQLRRRFVECRRVFKFGQGYQYVEHEPSIVLDPSGRDLMTIKHLGKEKTARLGIFIYHYTAIFRSQVERKNRSYALREWKDKSENMEASIENWLSLKDPFHLQSEFRYYSWLERFKGTHPPEIMRLREDIRSGKIAVDMRYNADVERLLASLGYKFGRIYVQLLERTRSLYERYFRLLSLGLRPWSLARVIISKVRALRKVT